MKKKIISTVLSMLSIIFIGVFAPFSAYAEGEDFSDITASIIAELYRAIFQADSHSYESEISNSLYDYFENSLFEDLEIKGNLPNYKLFDASQIVNYTIEEKKYQFAVRFTYLSVTEYLEKDLGYLRLGNRDYNPNIAYITIYFDDGAVYYYRLITQLATERTVGYYNDYVTISFRNATLVNVGDGSVVGTGYSTSYQLYYNNYNDSTYNLIPDLYDTSYFLQGFGTSTSGGQTWRKYPLSEHIALGNLYSHYTKNYDFTGSSSTTNVRCNKYYCIYAESNDYEMNNKITANPNTNTIYYYNNTFKKGDVYNGNMITQITENRNNRLPKYYDDNISGGGGWNSPDYPIINGTAVIQPDIVEFSTADIPSNLMGVGTSFLSESLNVVDVIPNYLLCLGIVFMVWVCFHIFGK